jgi:hypothetical protein
MKQHPVAPHSERFAETAAAPTELGVDQRTQPDQRQEPTRPWWAFPPAGRRLRNRRAVEHCRPYFVDRFSTTVLVFVLMLLIASITDAVLTIQLIQAGGSEINPLMARLLDHGVLPFLLGKYLLTVIGLPLLLVFKNFYLFGTRIRVGYLIPMIVALYALLIGYQLVLMHQRPWL